MKTSNIILISAICLAVVWTLLIGWFGSSAIKNNLQGKDPYFMQSNHKYLENHKKTFAAPVNELFISGEWPAVLTLIPGKELCVLSNPMIWTCEYTDLKNGRSMISLKNHKDITDPVTITIPRIPRFSIDNFSEVKIQNLNQDEIRIQCKQLSSFSSGNCKIGTLSLDFPRSRDRLDIHIDSSNHIETFIVAVKGSGKLRLETAGNLKNQFSLSDSVKLETTYELMKKLR
jgi:hypothetical protein